MHKFKARTKHIIYGQFEQLYKGVLIKESITIFLNSSAISELISTLFNSICSPLSQAAVRTYVCLPVSSFLDKA